MQTPLLVAKRYFFAKRKKNFIHIIAGISALGVMVGTMALVVVLSVFNGLENLIMGLFGSFDSDLKITLVEGKAFEYSTQMHTLLSKISGVGSITEVVEDNALMKYKDKQLVVKVKGVSDHFGTQYGFSSMIKEGQFGLKSHGRPLAMVGRGIQYKMGIQVKDHFTPLEIWFPKRGIKGHMNPEKSFNTAKILPIGVFAIEKQYDDHYVFVPLDFAMDLMEMHEQRHALEIQVKEGNDIETVQMQIEKALGPQFKVETSQEQHSGLLKAIRIEKLFAYITFSFILAISSLNIFFSLSMLAIEKRKDLIMLQVLGADRRFIAQTFLWIAAIIAGGGALTGLVAGFLLCIAQKQFGLVSMGMETSVVDAYPVVMHASDFMYTALTLVVITLLASFKPAMTAGKA